MELIAKCGNRCDLCPAYRENIRKYGEEQISAGWNKYLGFYLPPDKIECVGCHIEGYRPSEACVIRSCCAERGWQNCGYCAETDACSSLLKNMEEMERLEKLAGIIPQADYDMYFRPYQNQVVLRAVKESLR